MPKRGEFLAPHFILGEGYEDAAFLSKLVKSRKLSNFDISGTVDMGGAAGGNSGFEEALIASTAITNFDNVKNVVIFADNDDNPSAAFAAVTKQISKAQKEGNLSDKWTIPDRPGIKAKGEPSLAIWMWPEPGQKGSLETLLWRVILSKYPKEAACVQTACECAETTNWPVSKLDKARVRCFIALSCKRHPAITLGNLWRSAPNLIPVTAAEFGTITDFLREIANS